MNTLKDLFVIYNLNLLSNLRYNIQNDLDYNNICSMNKDFNNMNYSSYYHHFS